MKKLNKKATIGRFVAIDFEIADLKHDSACALSVVVVNKKEIEYSVEYLIRPPRKRFTFTHIHGIKTSDVANKPTFFELWPEIFPLFINVDFIAAHNAYFDRSVLHTCCNKKGFAVPDVRFLCTVLLSRWAWGIYPTKLPDVCRYLGIPLKHHNASSDAIACAKIVIEAQNQTIRFPDLIYL